MLVVYPTLFSLLKKVIAYFATAAGARRDLYQYFEQKRHDFATAAAVFPRHYAINCPKSKSFLPLLFTITGVPAGQML
ncbi:MAG: hypothetical protein ACR5LG_09595 [Sodalis sp. (in: enterobacteria)]|uniref:hypothetical protein n=1 Tax=Sodalis sp. (in: enterobacteria) TaxID=1898979 RepID=UPI003F30CBC8